MTTTEHYYSVEKRGAPAPLARLFMTTTQCSFYVDGDIAQSIDTLSERSFFHGEPVEQGWIRRLPSEGGGYCFQSSAKEIV